MRGPWAIPRGTKRWLALALVFSAAWFAWRQPTRTRPLHRAEWLEAGGMRLRALRGGTGDTTLFFLHGYGESLMGWRLILDRFTGRYRVIAIDLPGFGLSDKPTGPYTTRFMADVLNDVLSRWTKGPVVVVGHSLGGQLAAQLALDNPERVVAAVLIAPSGAGISPLLSDTSGVSSTVTHWVASAAGYVLPIHDPAWLAEDSASLAYLPSEDSSGLAAARLVLDEFDFSSLRDSFSQLYQPVLLIWGRNDPTVPYGIGERIARMLPCRRFVTLNATLHRPQQSRPDTVAAEMLRFIKHPACE